MCVIEKKTYRRADGQSETIETTRRCHRATGSQLCDKVEHRSAEQATIVERSPATEQRYDKAYIVTEGRDGRGRVYRDVTRQTSRRTSNIVRRDGTASNRTSMDTPISASSSSAYSFFEARPAAPSPPPAASGIPVLERERRPRFGTNDPSRSVAPDGTAIYERPPSLEIPRARENERRARFAMPGNEGRTSFTSTTAVDEPPIIVEPPRRRPSIRVNTARSSASISPATSSPGLSQLPKVGHLRNDSARDIPGYRPRDSREDVLRREEERQAQLERNRLAESERRQEARRDEREAQLERDRLAESERRQEARRNAALNPENTAREASKERDRHEAAAALEGERKAVFMEEQLQGEYAQMARERAAAEARKRELDPAARYADDQLRRDADARARYAAHINTSPRLPRRTTTGGESSRPPYSASPVSARSSLRTGGGVIIHQEQLPTVRRDSIAAKGAEVIAREQARGSLGATDSVQMASRRLSEVVGEVSLEDQYDYNVEGGEYVVEEHISQGRREREYRKVSKGANRAERKRDFWRDDRYP